MRIYLKATSYCLHATKTHTIYKNPMKLTPVGFIIVFVTWKMGIPGELGIAA